MGNSSSFLLNFFKERKTVGAVAPSSRFLAAKMLKDIDFDQARVIVELGPGTGVFTKRILEKLHPEGKLFVFELNTAFLEKLKAVFHDSRVVFINDSAEKIKDYLNQHNIKQADVVVSSLPLANFPDTLKNNILQAASDVLKEGATFVQFQYSLNARKKIKTHYKEMNISFTPINFPPAFVYTCKK
jgi:phospholipid N-methyltransferase